MGLQGQEKRTWLPPHYAVWLIPAEGQGEIKIVDLGEAAGIDDAVQQARKALEKADTTIRQEGEAEAEKQLRDVMRTSPSWCSSRWNSNAARPAS